MSTLTKSTEVKGLVLAGGRGTRLLPLTAQISKQLLPVGGKPLVVRVIDQLINAGIKDILLLIDERYASEFMQILKDGSDLGLRSLAYIWQHPEGKGIPSAIYQAKNFIERGKIVVVCGDVLIEEGIKKPVSDFMKQKSGARLTTTYLKDTAGYSPLINQGDNVHEILSKDKNRHESGLIDLGIYMYHQDVFERIENLNPSKRGETEVWDLNSLYAKEGNLKFSAISGWWSDVGGSIDIYEEADKRYAGK